MNTKDLLLKQTDDAFSGENGMSIKASLKELTQEEASWRLNDTTWTIEEILYHLAECNIECCKQGFGGWKSEYGKPIGDIDKMLDLLDASHEYFVQCLQECSEEDMEKPIEAGFPAKSTTDFFWIMIMHDVSHAAQIRAIRRAYGSRTHFRPV